MKTKDYRKEMLRKKGVIVGFYQNFVVPTVKQLKGGKCERCGSNKFIDVHHLDYDNLTLDNFRLLCRSCHKKTHPRIKRGVKD